MNGTDLDVRGVSVRFGGVQALRKVDLRVEAGQIVGVLGPNGAGKTTLFNVITGFVPPDEGQVEALGRDVTRLAPDKRSRLGVVRTFQAMQIFDHLSVYENVLVGFHARWRGGAVADALALPFMKRERVRLRSAAAELLDLLNIADYAGAAPGDTPFGVLRRVELARALAAGPRLLLLDEPASGLHVHERADLATTIAGLRGQWGISIVLVEHDVDLMMGLADVVYVLDFGRVVATGPPSAIRRNPEVQRAYLGSMV